MPNTTSATVVNIPVWLMSVIVAAALSAGGGTTLLGIQTYATLQTLTERVNRLTEARYMTVARFEDRMHSRDGQITDLYTRYRDMRKQMRYYHGQGTDALGWPPTPNPQTKRVVRYALHKSPAQEVRLVFDEAKNDG